LVYCSRTSSVFCIYIWRHTVCTCNLNGTTHVTSTTHCNRICCLSTSIMKKKLYSMHLECANAWNSIRKYMATCVNKQLNISMDNLYLKLNKNLDNLHKQNKKRPRHKTAIHTTDITYILHTHTHTHKEFVSGL
jgi:hypothetical protein